MPADTGDHLHLIEPALSDAPEGMTELPFGDPETAAYLVRWWKDDPQRMRELRLALLREGTATHLSRIDDDTAIRIIGARLHSGHIRLRRSPLKLDHSGPSASRGGGAAAEIEQAPPPATAEAPPKSWISFQVVWDDSGEPLGDIRLCVRLPHGRERHHVASEDGKVHIGEVPPGTCDVRCEFNSPTTANTVAFVSVQQGDHIEAARPPGRERKGRQQIAQVEEHKVADGESLESLALDADLTWQELTQFNWETDDPDKVNEHLRWDVGCRRKIADGANFLFTSEDDPGIIRIPRPWLASDLPTGEDYVIRVRSVVRAPEWLFSI